MSSRRMSWLHDVDGSYQSPRCQLPFFPTCKRLPWLFPLHSLFLQQTLELSLPLHRFSLPIQKWFCNGPRIWLNKARITWLARCIFVFNLFNADTLANGWGVWLRGNEIVGCPHIDVEVLVNRVNSLGCMSFLWYLGGACPGAAQLCCPSLSASWRR
jgi:hypothetical protein